MSDYVSSQITRYGDVARVKADAKTVNEILARQGSSFLIDLIAESVGNHAITFKLNNIEIGRVKDSLIDNLLNALAERT